MSDTTTYGQIRVPVGKPAYYISATLTQNGWKCEVPAISRFLDSFHPPDLEHYLPAPWDRVLKSAAEDLGGKVVASKPATEATGIH